MVQKHLHPVLAVPEMDGRPAAVRSGSARDLSGMFRAFAPAILVAAGVGATLAWIAFLGWTAFGVLRWALG